MQCLNSKPPTFVSGQSVGAC